MDKENLQTKHENKKTKKVLLISLIAILVVCFAVGGFFAFKYIFPSDKDLFLMAHKNLFSSETESPDVYTKDTNLSFELDGGFNSPNVVETVKSISVSTKNTHFDENRTAFDFNIQFLNKDFLSFSNVYNGDKEILTVPQLIDESYASNDAEEVLSMLLGSESAKDKNIFDGVDKETFEKYLKKYGKKLYDNVRDSAFASVKENGEKVITFKDDANRLLYDIVYEIKNDTEFRDFLYEQTSIIYTNINEKFPYAGTLLTIPTKAEYEESYNENLSDFVKNIENAKITATAHIEGKKLVSESIKITQGTEPAFDISYDDENLNFVQYKDSKEHIRYSSVSETEGTKIQKNNVFSIDINQWTKEQSDTQKMMSIMINSTLDTVVNEEFIPPADYTDISLLTDEEKAIIQETVSKNVTEILASFTLALLFL